MDYLTYIKGKYSYLNDGDVEVLISSAKEILINLLYPFDKSIDLDNFDVPKRFTMWVARAIVEMIERQGISSAVAYSENGLNITFDRSQLSYGLISEITPYAGGC